MKFNTYFQKQFDSNNCELLPENIKKDILSDFENMSDLDIENEEDQRKFFLVRNLVPQIILSMWDKKINNQTAQILSREIFRNRDINPIGTFLQLIEAIDLALKKMIPETLIPKLAYPQSNWPIQLPQYDIGRWVSATRKIYELMNKGYQQDQAKQTVLGNWEPSEQMDYNNWLKFYNEKVPDKYPKLATADAGFFGSLPISALRTSLPSSGKIPNPIPSGEGHATKVSPGLPQHLPHDINDVRDTIEKQRNKLIGRLNSAEKLLSNMDGQLFAGDEQELMIKLLHDLKRRIQVANKRTVKSSLFEDQIFLTANYLQSCGKIKQAGFFYKIAQLPPSPLDDFAGMPSADAAPGATPEETPGTDEGKGDSEATHNLLKDFFDNLSRGVSGDPMDTPEERKNAEITLGKGSWILKTAQLPPKPLAQAPEKTAPNKVKNVFVPEPENKEEIPNDSTDDIIEAALSNVTIDDVINRLEMLVSVYNQREIARQLGILDIMMDRLGLASFFPALGEAMSKALESNQYIGSRLGDILTQVRGSVDTPGASEWVEVNKKENPQTSEIRKRLEAQKEKEQKRKDLRKQKEDDQAEGKPTSKSPGAEVPIQIPVEETAALREPARIEKSPKINTR